MMCPRCGSEDVTIEMVQTSGKRKDKGIGAGGHANNAARGLTAVCTLGVSNIFWKKSNGTGKMKYDNQKVCLCQNCGNSWTLK